MKSIFVLGSMITLLVVTSCQSHDENRHEEHATYKTTSPVKLDTSFNKNYVCQIHAVQHIELRALEKGYLQKIHVDEGQLVRKGQLMFEVMPMLYKAELNRAKAEASFAEIEYKNTLALAERNVVSENELALAKAKFDKAQAEVDLAQVHLGFTQIKAPFDGIMDRFHVRLGSLVDEGELLTSLSDNTEMWVYFNVPEAEYLDYITSMKKDNELKVSLMLANGKIYEHQGAVSTIEADFNNETGNIAFRATFPNPDGILRHGETGTIIIPTDLEDAIVIPQKVTFEILDKRFVYVLDKNNVIQPRQVEIAAELPHLYVIQSGLSPKDKILLDGLRKVKKGDKVKVDYVDPKKAISELDIYAE